VRTNEPRITRRPRPERGTVDLNPHSLHLLGASGSPIYDLVIDCGTEEPAYVVKITADLAYILADRLNAKLHKVIGEQHV
jgi:hypothetical protein